MPKTCFFISRIGDSGSPERDFSDKLLKYIVAPVLEKCGYETPLRADQIAKPGLITTDVFTHLWNDDLVLADLTGGNPNVFYELAVRHIRRKPFIHMIHAGSVIPFDISISRTIVFGFDIAVVASPKQALEAMVKTSEDPTTVQTPLSAAIDFASASTSTDPVRYGIAQILSILQEIKGAVGQMSVGSGTRPRERANYSEPVPAGIEDIDPVNRDEYSRLRNEIDKLVLRRVSLADIHIPDYQMSSTEPRELDARIAEIRAEIQELSRS